MDMRKFTEKSTLALGKAQSVAREYGNQEIGQVVQKSKKFRENTKNTCNLAFHML